MDKYIVVAHRLTYTDMLDNMRSVPVFEEMVNEKIKQGYQCIGSVMVVPWNTSIIFVQSLQYTPSHTSIPHH